jgi:hypothetical protein
VVARRCSSWRVGPEGAELKEEVEEEKASSRVVEKNKVTCSVVVNRSCKP